MTNRTYCIAVIAIALFAAPSAFAAPRVYELVDYPTDQNGHSLSGTVTTVETAPDDGKLLDAEILAWEFEVTGPNGFSANSSQPNTLATGIGVMITPTEIVLPYPPFGGINDFQLLTENFVGRLAYIRSNNFMVGPFNLYEAGQANNNNAWQNSSPLMNNTLQNAYDGTWVIAKVVPEPSSLMVACLLGGPALLFRRRVFGRHNR